MASYDGDEPIEDGQESEEGEMDLADALVEVGDLYSDLEEHTKAIESYRASRDLDPDNPETTYLLAEEYLAVGWLNEAEHTYWESLRIDSEAAATWYGLARCLAAMTIQGMRGGNVSVMGLVPSIQAQTRPQTVPSDTAYAGPYLKAVELNEDYAESQYREGFLGSAIDATEQQLKRARRATETDPNDASAWMELAMQYDDQLRPWDAIVAYGKITNQLDSGNAGAWDGMGNAYVVVEDWEAALYAHQQAATLDPENPTHWVHVGDDNFAMADYDNAARSFERASRLDPEDASLLSHLGAAKLELEDYEGALDAFTRSYKLDAENPTAWRGAGSAAAGLERYEAATDNYRHAVDLDPTDLSTWVDMAFAYINLGKSDEALDAALHAAQRDPRSSDALNALGAAYYSLERDQEAVLAYQQAIMSEPEQAEIYENLAEALQRLDREDEAELALDRARQLHEAAGSADGEEE